MELDPILCAVHLSGVAHQRTLAVSRREGLAPENRARKNSTTAAEHWLLKVKQKAARLDTWKTAINALHIEQLVDSKSIKKPVGVISGVSLCASASNQVMRWTFLLSSTVLTSGSHSAMASPRSESSPPEYVCSILFLAPSCGEGMCCTHISTKPAGKRSVQPYHRPRISFDARVLRSGTWCNRSGMHLQHLYIAGMRHNNHVTLIFLFLQSEEAKIVTDIGMQLTAEP